MTNKYPSTQRLRPKVQLIINLTQILPANFITAKTTTASDPIPDIQPALDRVKKERLGGGPLIHY